MSQGASALPVWLVPADELLRNGGSIPIQGGPAMPISFGGQNSLEDGQVPVFDGNGFSGVYPVLNGVMQPFVGFTQEVVSLINMDSGDTIYTPTIPVGHTLALIIQLTSNPTSSTVSHAWYLTRSGTDYPMRPAANLSARSPQSLSSPTGLRNGDTLKFTMGAAGQCVQFVTILVPDTASPRPVFLSVPLVSGDNTVYTCPAGKKARMTSASSLAGVFLAVFNISGEARVYSHYKVPANGSPSASGLFLATNANSGATPFAFGAIGLTEGESYVVNSDGAGTQIIHCQLWEEDI